jgi:4-alpha-glucanotransferase
MGELNILRLIIERMPSDPSHFVNDLDQAPYISVASPSTHDMSTLREWWDEDTEYTQKYYNEIMKWEGPAPHPATPEVIENIIHRHLDSESMLAIFPIQDLLGISGKYRAEDPSSERINTPSNSFHYWRYRTHLSLEELILADDLIAKVKQLVETTKRSQTK